MAHRDMRDFLKVLEQQGRLRRVRQPVDRMWEPACLAKWMYQALPSAERFGLFFEKVKGSRFALMTGVLGANTETVALALGVEPHEINETWVAAARKPIAPRIVARGVSQEHVLTGEEASLDLLPIPVWTPGKDKGPYITTIVITKNAETGVQNMGVYRTMVVNGHSVVVNLNPGRHGHNNMKTWHARAKPAPIAWVVASEPVVHLATVANLPYGADEIELAGGLKGEGIEMVRCKTIDLAAPANAEFIIEGELQSGETGTEGPFGEFAGFMGPVEDKPVARITAITHRSGAIYYGYTSQMPPSESTTIQSLTNAGLLLKFLRHDFGDPSVKDVFIDLTFGGLLAHAIIAVAPRYPGHGKRIGRLVAEFAPLKRVTVVDADVDIRDPLHVEWALNACYDPARDTVIIDDVFFPLHMDPSVRTWDNKWTLGSKIVVDATQKIDSGLFSLPDRALMEKALETWRAAELPDFAIPKRAASRLARS